MNIFVTSVPLLTRFLQPRDGFLATLFLSKPEFRGRFYEGTLRVLRARLSLRQPDALFRAPHGRRGQQRQRRRKRHLRALGENYPRRNQKVAGRSEEHTSELQSRRDLV